MRLLPHSKARPTRLQQFTRPNLAAAEDSRRPTRERLPVQLQSGPRVAPLALSVRRREPEIGHDAVVRRNEVLADSLQLYMREMGRTPLLTPAQETALAERVNAGDPAARELMIRSNLRLVVKIAREYEGLGLSLPDLISEGNIGLVKAVDRFDPGRGARLSSYSALWIRQQIRRALSNQSRTIRLPVHTLGQIQQLRRSAADLKERLGREATHEELSRVMGLPSRRVATLQEAGLPAASLEAPLSSEISGSLSDVVADEGATNPAEAAEQNDAIRLLRQLLPRLPRREAVILRARFGLDTGEESTLDAIGAKLGVTRERIRQLQQIALQRLRDMLEEGGNVAASA